MYVAACAAKSVARSTSSVGYLHPFNIPFSYLSCALADYGYFEIKQVGIHTKIHYQCLSGHTYHR